MPPRGVQKGTKRARQYEHIKQSERERGTGEARAKEIAARTLNKERAGSGESQSRSRTSIQDMPSSRRGNQRSGTSRPIGDEQADRGRAGRSGLGDQIRAAEKGLYFGLIDEVDPMGGSRELVVSLKERQHTVVLASSAKADEVDHYLDLLDIRELADGWTTSADVEATKPNPDLVRAALRCAGDGGERAVMVGDTPWDVQAARNAGVPTVAVLTGGFAIEELRGSGAGAVFESVAQLCVELDRTPLGTASC
jgi:HAD superfamily hydrolase (TIGR01509 family)